MRRPDIGISIWVVQCVLSFTLVHGYWRIAFKTRFKQTCSMFYFFNMLQLGVDVHYVVTLKVEHLLFYMLRYVKTINLYRNILTSEKLYSSASLQGWTWW